MKKIAIIAAMMEEIAPFYKKLENHLIEDKKGFKVNIGSFNNYKIYAVQCGVCKVNAATAAQMIIDNYDIDLFIMVGVSGAIEDLKIGDTVISTKVAHHDVDPEIMKSYRPFLDNNSGYFTSDIESVEKVKKILKEKEYKHGIYYGAMVSGEQFITDDGREKIINDFSPLCVDMETSAVAHACYSTGIPFFAIRSITDTKDESGEESFKRNYEEARTNSLIILEDILSKIIL